MIPWIIAKFDEWWLGQIDIGRVDDGENWWKQGSHWIKLDHRGFYIEIYL